MKKQKQLPALSDNEKRRLTEIEFYILVEHMFGHLGEKPSTYEFIEIICRITGASTTLIKTIITGARAINSTIRPHTEELCVMLYRADRPVSQIAKITGVSPKTVYLYIEKYYTRYELEYLPRVRQDYYEHLVKFTDKLKGLFQYDEHLIPRG